MNVEDVPFPAPLRAEEPAPDVSTGSRLFDTPAAFHSIFNRPANLFVRVTGYVRHGVISSLKQCGPGGCCQQLL